MAIRQKTTLGRKAIVDVELVDLAMDQVRASHLKAEVLEIGAVMLDGRYALVDRFHALVTPGHAKGLYEKRYEALEKDSDGKSTLKTTFGKAMVAFCDWLGDAPIDLYMWSESDYHILCEQIRWQTPKDLRNELLSYLERSIDLQKLFMKALGANNCPSLDYAMELVHEPFQGKRHHALDDAENTARVFAKLARSNRLPEKPVSIPVAERTKQNPLPVASIASLLGLPDPPREAERKPRTPYGIKTSARIAFSVSSFFTPGLSHEHRILETIDKVFHGKEPSQAAEEPEPCPTFLAYTTRFFSREDGAFRASHPEVDDETGKAYDEVFVGRVLDARFSQKQLCGITQAEARSFCKYLCKRHPTSCQQALFLLKEVCDQAWKDGLLPFNGDVTKPFAGARKPKAEESLGRLFSFVWPEETHAVIVQTMVLTGLSFGDVTSLLAEDARQLADQIGKEGLPYGWKTCLLSDYLAKQTLDPYAKIFGEIPPTKREVRQTLTTVEKRAGMGDWVPLEELRMLGIQKTGKDKERT